MVYAVRYTKEGRENITDLAYAWAEWTNDIEAALALEEAIGEAIATLSTNPRRVVAAPDESSLLSMEVRRLLVRPTQGRTAYHVFFAIFDDSDDGPTVQVVHVRDARRLSLTTDEAEQVRINQ